MMRFPLPFVISITIFVIFLKANALALPVKDDAETKIIVLEDDDMEPTILDCDYEISDKNSFLTVKWLRNGKSIYQWIRGSHPSPIPEFKNEVDSSYEASTDPHKQYSSLALINPTIETTGDYKCVVQTKNESYMVQQRVQVIDVRNYTLNLYHYKIENETQLECTVSNVFPRPTLTITSNDDDIVKVITNDPQENENGYYNATTIAAVYDDDEDVDSYKCVVTFDGYSQNLTTVATSTATDGSQISVRLMLLSCCLYCILSKLIVIG